MKPLNIPLTGSKQTARRRRRAVWRWGFLLIGCLLVWSLVHLKATRNPFLEHTPNNTRFILHLQPTSTQWSQILRVLGNEVLTPTGLTLRELAPSVRGSLVLFFEASGDVVIGLEGKLTEKDQTLLEAYDIHAQLVAPNRYLLARSPRETHLTPTHIGVAQRLLPFFAGSLMDVREGAPHTILRANRKGLSLDVPDTSQKEGDLFLNQKTVFSGRFSPETPLHLPAFIEPLFGHLTGNTSFAEVLLEDGAGGTVAMFRDETYLLTLEKELSVPTIQKILGFQARLTTPLSVSRILRDGTRVEELRTMETTPAPEHIEEPDWTILRLETETDTFFAGKHKQKPEVFFTNSADILIEKTQQKEQKGDFMACGSPSDLFIHLPEFSSLLQHNQHHFSTPLPLSSSPFVYVSLDKSPFGNKMTFCEGVSVENSTS